MIYLDNAATGGVKPPRVINAVNSALKFYSANPGRSGHDRSMRAAEKIYEARREISDFFGGTGAENVAFTLNCTYSINCVLKGVLKGGDHIIVSDMEHNAVMRPLYKMAKENGVSVDVAKTEPNDDVKTVENFEKLIKNNTKIIFCTHASNVFGFVNPIEKLGELCKSRGILFGVDAAQSGGVLDINAKNCNIDYLCIAPHKGLYAPMGVGILIARKPLDFTVTEGGTGTDSVNFEQPKEFPERVESGTVALPAILGTLAGLEFLKEKGRETIYRREMKLVQRLYDGISKIPNVKLYTDFPREKEFVPVLSFNLRDFDSSETAMKLNSLGFALRGGLHCTPTAHEKMGTLPAGTVRASIGAFNNERDIDALIFALKKL